ncbi:MAG: helix-hairpin-helix domain-containing protein, partial [Synergistaceae bacterium]|nr:helix-hairpin-helix domain-containing protein [Synergistaceae bacterium]
LAAKLRDEAHIAVPAVTPPAPDVSPPPQLAQNAAGAPWRSPDPSGASGAGAVSYPRRESRADDKNKIDINRADASQLNTLPGIGPKLSAAIVGYREANGPFESVDDLRNVRGIGEKRLEAIRELVTAGI